MMGYLLLVGVIVCSTAAGLCASFFNRKNAAYKNVTPLYNLVMSFCALVCWGIMYFRGFSFEPGVLLYSLIFGLCYTGATVGQIYALRYGPLSLTNLIMQLSGIGTAIWGIFFWGSELSVTVILGLILVIVSLVFCIAPSGGGYRISLKWLVIASAASLSNVGCAVTQKTQQINFDFRHGEQMMFFAMIIAVIVCLVICLQVKPEKPVQVLKKTAFLPAAAGGLNMVVNLMVILLAATALSPSLIYPTTGVGGLALTSIASRFLFKEKLSTRQWVGVVIGAAAIALLSL